MKNHFMTQIARMFYSCGLLIWVLFLMGGGGIPLWGFKNIESWHCVAPSRISLVKGERNVRYGEATPDTYCVWGVRIEEK